ncbi:MAG: MaoC family dehydratase N-terminal domain-containing protein [Chloroflexi bacterium]|nr:MaoC family dehydratase N-terminal domain-containing protein [Chloroflexota bacterium]
MVESRPASAARGLYFEEFEVGQEVTSPGRTITETDIVLFAGLSGDYNPLHTDAEFARGSLFGQRVAHGLLGLAIASGLASRLQLIEGTAQAFTGLDWKFKGPIYIGDTVSVQARVTQKKALSALGGGMVVLEVELINQKGEVVQKGDWSVLIKGRPG